MTGKERQLIIGKLEKLREARILSTDASIQFKLEYEIADLERMLEKTESRELISSSPNNQKKSMFWIGVLLSLILILLLVNMFSNGRPLPKSLVSVEDIKDKKASIDESKVFPNLPSGVSNSAVKKALADQTISKKANKKNLPVERKTNKTEPKLPEFTSKDYINTNQTPQIAIFRNVKTQLLENAVFSYFKTQGIPSSNNYFKSKFKNQFGDSIENIDFSSLGWLKKESKLKCICQLTEEIKYVISESDDLSFTTAKGAFSINIFSLVQNNYSEITFDVSGGGADTSYALEDLKGKLLKNDKLKTLDISLCK